MSVDDRPADRQPHARAVWLRREERIEHAICDFGRKPRPKSSTATRRVPGPPSSLISRSTRGRCMAVPMASTPFIIRFRITCCNWTGSPRTGARFSEQSISIETSCRHSSLRISARTLQIAPLMSNSVISGAVFLASARMLRMISLVQQPVPDDALRGRARLIGILSFIRKPAQARVAVHDNGAEGH